MTNSHMTNLTYYQCTESDVFILTMHLKAGQEALEEVFAWIRHCNRTKFRHHNAVMLSVFLVAIAVQEAAHVCHFSILNMKLVHKCHPIKPVVETEEQTQQLIHFSCDNSVGIYTVLCKSLRALAAFFALFIKIIQEICTKK